jgi:small subunit ribosomal protein S20
MHRYGSADSRTSTDYIRHNLPGELEEYPIAPCFLFIGMVNFSLWPAGGDFAMPILKQQIKRAQTDIKRAERNKAIDSKVKTAVRTFEKSLAGADAESKKAAYVSAARELDKAANKGVIHRNAASRRKSRLASKLNAALS